MNILIKDILAVRKLDGVYKAVKSDIYVSGNRITGIDNAPDGFKAERVLDGKGKLLSAGFVNSHTHAYMSLFRNCADDLAFSDWLFGHIMPMEDKLVGEDAYWGTLLSCIEMIKTGTTCFLDMHLFKHYVAQAVQDIGIRAVISRGLVGEGDDEGGRKRIDEAVSDIEEFADCSRITFMLGPHAPYTCDDKYLEICARTAKDYGCGIHVHLAESDNEMRQIRERYSCTPVELMEKTGIFDNKTVAAHCVNLTDCDIAILKKYDVSVATNPVSNLKLANGAAPVVKLLEAGVNVCLGTDSSASNNNLNMINELNTLTLIHKGINKDAKVVSANAGYGIATENGARALGLECGVIEVGALADLAVFDIEKPWFYPRNDLVAALSYSATGAECETVIADGQIVMENGIITAVDEKEVYENCERIIQRVRS